MPRKLILSLCTLAIGIAANAQTMSHGYDLPMYDSRHAVHMVEVKPHVAIGFSTLMQNYGKALPGITDLQLTPGVLMRTGVDVRFAIRNSFALATGLDFDINNSKYALSLVDNNTGSISSLYVSNHFYEVSVPLYMSLRLNLGQRMRWNIDAGAYIAWAAGGKTRSSGYTSGINSLGQPVITHITNEVDYFESQVSVINSVKGLDYGPRLATGLTYRQHYSLNLVAELSLPNLAINHNVLDVKYRNFALAFEFGYNF